MKSYILVGKIVGIYGLKGEVKIKSWTNSQLDILKYSNWFIGDKKEKFNFNIKSSIENRIIVKLKNIESIDDAKNYVHEKIYIRQDQLTKKSENEFYWKDLISCKVFNKDGVYFGFIKDLIDNGVHSILIIKPNENSFDNKERLIPFVKNYILDVNLKDNIVIIDWQIDY